MDRAAVKIAIVSDLHLKFWERLYGYTKALDIIRDTLKEGQPDLVIDCGDREYYWERISPANIQTIYVMGNHDYYGGEVSDQFFSLDVDGIRVAGATMWTDLNNRHPLAKLAVTEYLVDFRCIKKFTTDKWLDCHDLQYKFLTQRIEKGVDIIVTHHCPSLKSCHERHQQAPVDSMAYAVNYGFASHLDHIVSSSGAKLWAHGHTHDPHDYVIGDTRVVCNPCGYPRERFQTLEEYQPVYVEL